MQQDVDQTIAVENDKPILKSGNFWLFMILGLNFWFIPLLPEQFLADWLIDVMFGIILLFALLFQGDVSARFRKLTLTVCALVFVAIIADELWISTRYAQSALLVICFALVTLIYLGSIAADRGAITYNTIFAAACTYMFIGMFFAALFVLLQEFDPNAFNQPSELTNRYDVLYFSFVTLTTLGYGDVTPVSDIAKMLTVFEALIGQIYVAVVIAAIVGSYSANVLHK